jgi:hypothetical protein
MRRFWAIVVLALVVPALVANVALAGNQQHFRGKGAGTTDVLAVGDQEFLTESRGTLTATGFGSSSYYISAEEDWITAYFPDNPCGSLEGHMTVTVANGDQLFGTIEAGSRVCEDAPYDGIPRHDPSYTSNLLWFITGGTGRFAGVSSVSPIGIVGTSTTTYQGTYDAILDDSFRMVGQLSY